MFRRPVLLATVLALTASGLAVAAPAATSLPVSPVPAPAGLHAAWPGGAPRAAGADPRAQARAAFRAAHPAEIEPSLTAGSGRTVEVTVSGGGARQLQDAVRAVDGTSRASASGQVTATVARTALTRLAAAPGVDAVRAPVRAVEQGGPVSEGVAASGADSWQAAGTDGSGVSVGVVDAGFGGLAAAVAAGDLPAGTVVNQNKCANVNASDHGTAVAEIVHQTAPGATIHLYCVDDAVGLAAVAAPLVAAGDTVVNSSLGFPGDGRGDGSGTASATVASLRKQGVLWVGSAGNSAADHWSGTLADADNDGAADLLNTSDAGEFDGVFLAGTNTTGGSTGTSGEAFLRFDQWPTSSAHVALAAYGYECTDNDCTDERPINDGNPMIVAQNPGTAPVLSIPIENNSPFDEEWDFVVVLDTGFPKVHYDLSYQGEVSNSYLSTKSDTRAAAGSIESPADSPYALAVGAADVGADGSTRGTLEPFSSQGPTIDGRTKPEITAWDGVSSPVFGAASTDPSAGTGFYGTSAAAPHVAGAAALVKAAQPGLDAAQIQDVLLRRAGRLAGGTVNPGSPFVPALNSYGAGLLTLGDAPTAGQDLRSPGSRYTPTTPTRLVDTRSTGGRLGAGGTVQVSVPGLPADATSVAVNITGVGATGTTYLTAYPGANNPGTSNLNLSATDPTAAVFAVVPVFRGSVVPSITVRNSTGAVDVLVDELGYFGTGDETGRYTTLATPTRVLDTRTTTGGHKGKLANRGSVIVGAGAPSGATAAVVDVTAVTPSANGYFAALPSCGASVSTLNYGKYTRAALSVVPLSAAGTLCLTNVGPSVDALVDVVGYLSDSATGAEYHALTAQQRVVDTRSGNGGSAGGRSPRPLAPATATAFYGANVGSVPASASALFTSVVEASNTAGGFLTLSPGRTNTPTSNLNFTSGRVVSNAAVVGLGTGSNANIYNVYNAAGSTQVAVDVVGYFAPAPSK